MTPLLLSARRALAVAVCLGVVAAVAPRAGADENASGFDPEVITAMAKKLGLSKQQQLSIRKIHDDTRKAEVKLQAEIEVHSIDLRRELEREDPREKSVATLIEKIARLEGEVRKTRVLAALSARKILSANQRKKLEAMRADRLHPHLVLEREARELARAGLESDAARAVFEAQEMEERAKMLEEQARAETKAHRRELEQAARQLRERARELERAHREQERQYREQERQQRRELERVRERERESRRERSSTGRSKISIESGKPAKVVLDGKLIGTTPLVVKAKTGEHVIVLQWNKSKSKHVVTVKADSDMKLHFDPPK